MFWGIIKTLAPRGEVLESLGQEGTPQAAGNLPALIQQGLGGYTMPLENEAKRVDSASREGYWLCAL